MIIWSGWGFLSGIFALVGILTGALVGSFAGGFIACLIGGIVAAGLNHTVAKKTGGGKMMIDPETGQNVMLKKSNSLFFIPMSWYTPVFVAAGLICGVLSLVADGADKQMAKDYPGLTAYREANARIDRKKGAAQGNTPEATKAAEAFAGKIRMLQKMTFDDGGDSRTSSDNFPTYCYLAKDEVTFMCRVPEMRGYKEDDTKIALTNLAWRSAVSAAKALPGIKAESEVTIALRGASGYEIIGKGKISDPGVEIDKKADMTILYKNFDPGNKEK